MSLAETQQIYDVLVQIDAILKGIEVKTVALQQRAPAVRENLKTFMQLERLALRYLVLARRMGLPEEYEQAVNGISRLVVSMRMAMISINLMMASNPVTMAIGFAGLAGVAIELGSGSILEGY
jgi:hypothetical protein